MDASAVQALLASAPDIPIEKSTLEFQPETEHFALVKPEASMSAQSRNASSTDVAASAEVAPSKAMITTLSDFVITAPAWMPFYLKPPPASPQTPALFHASKHGPMAMSP
jgi:hypothetical protein